MSVAGSAMPDTSLSRAARRTACCDVMPASISGESTAMHAFKDDETGATSVPFKLGKEGEVTSHSKA